MTPLKYIAAALACLLLLSACGARGGNSSSAPESGPASSESESPPTVTIDPEQGAAEALERELEKSMDRLANDFAAVLPSCDAARIAAVISQNAENLQYFQNVKISSAEAEPTGKRGFYQLTLNVSEPGSTLLMAGTYTYFMQVGYQDFGGEDLTVRCIANEKQYRSLDEIDADPAMRQVHTLRSCTDFGEFARPQDVTMPKLMDYLIIIASFDARERGVEQFEFTQDEINAVAKKYFGFPSFVFLSAKEYDAAKGVYVLYGRGGTPRNERVINRVDTGDGVVEVYVEVFSDPLQLMMEKIVCYRLSPNDDGSYRFLSAERIKLD